MRFSLQKKRKLQIPNTGNNKKNYNQNIIVTIGECQSTDMSYANDREWYNLLSAYANMINNLDVGSYTTISEKTYNLIKIDDNKQNKAVPDPSDLTAMGSYITVTAKKLSTAPASTASLPEYINFKVGAGNGGQISTNILAQLGEIVNDVTVDTSEVYVVVNAIIDIIE